MSREIKFRAWNSVTKEMEQVTQINLKNHYVQTTFNKIGYSYGQPDDVIVEQYTGLKDVNGKEIYEGDIIKFFGANKKIKAKNEFGIIVYKADRYGAGFNSIIQNKEHGYGGINIAQDIVVGNVHTNPELLEAQHDTRTD
ncbi:YopX family protein [Lentilactobacillus otakiensis]|uniref:YopX family protein n=1 Tax=Lentilactobacillus otakiensis TaxID=481720 RepID=UPI00293CE652|nr:YopX family protein [Lentilactobacillus otakiensis]MDV3518448.1 YopX family protein [Lentilactobacillus otakiensis]